MRKRTKIFYAKLLALFVTLLCVFIFVYTYQLRQVIEDNTLLSIRETAMHDRVAISGDIEAFLDELAGIGKRIALRGPKTVDELEANLNLENETSQFSELFLISGSGRVYTDKFAVYELEDVQRRINVNLRSFLEPDIPGRLVSRFHDRTSFAGIARSSILYVVKLDNTDVAGIPMSCIVGITSIEALQKRMVLEGFDIDGRPRGASALIDQQGNYIVGKAASIFIGDENNFFSGLRGANGMDRVQIQQKMRKHETFSFRAAGPEEEILAYMQPFALNGQMDFGWYFVMTVNNLVLQEQQTTFSILSLSLLGIVMTIFILLMLYAMSVHNKLYQTTEGIKLREEFLSNMSHEIRTPLNGLLGMNYLISSHIDDPENINKIREWLNKSRRLGEYLLSMLNDILDMSKLRAHKMDLVLAPMSIEQLLEDIMAMQGAVVGTKNIRMLLEKDVPYPWVEGDQTRIKQILTNIMGNAAKFTPENGTIELTVTQKLVDRELVETTFICKDTGIGMSQAFIDNIFAPFSQEHREASDTSLKGTGLGMPISLALAEAMGGSISVSSIVGEGSVFTVRILCEVAEADTCMATLARELTHKEEDIKHTLPLAGDACGRSTGGSGKMKVLVAEDAEFNAEFLMEVLTDEGFEPVHAENGQKALEIFSASGTGEFPVILMDMQMPVMDGCEATAAIRKLQRPDAATVIIYACTANTFTQDREKAMNSGMNDFLTKPVDVKVFLQKVDAVRMAAHGAKA